MEATCRPGAPRGRVVLARRSDRFGSAEEVEASGGPDTEVPSREPVVLGAPWVVRVADELSSAPASLVVVGTLDDAGLFDPDLRESGSRTARESFPLRRGPTSGQSPERSSTFPSTSPTPSGRPGGTAMATVVSTSNETRVAQPSGSSLPSPSTSSATTSPSRVYSSVPADSSGDPQ